MAAAAFPVFAEVSVSGVSGEVRDNVLLLLSLDAEPCDAPRRRIERAFEESIDSVRSALEAYGFYAPVISSDLQFGDDCWTAEYSIDPGEVVRLRNVNMQIGGEAAGDAAFTTLIDTSGIVVGAPLEHGRYDALKSALRRLALERGYEDADFDEARIDVYADELAADVTLVFSSGERYRFGDVAIEQDVLDPALVGGYLQITPGDFYDSRRIANARLELVNSGYFDDVVVRPGTADRASKTIPIAVRLTPAPRKWVNYGVGFSTDTGPRLRFGRNIRRWNEAGHQLTFSALLSPVVTEVTSNYRMPHGNPRYEWLSFDGGVKREYTDTSKSRSLQFGARRVREGEGSWMRTQYTSLLVEDFDVGGQSGRSRLLMPGMQWSRLVADNAIRPDRGSKLEFDARGAGDSVGSDTTFVQIQAQGKWIWSLRNRARILVRGRGGRTWERAFEELPPSVRFFAGGDNSVRGYGFETLGPTNADGEVIGGSRLVTMSFEYEHPVRQLWSIALFADAGNAFNDSSWNLQRSVGIGARWQSPLGPIRVDLAQPLDGTTRDVRLHISLGPDL
jgi:translocation and assembly module TamA